MTDWLLISCIASALVASGLGFLLFVNWRQERDRRRYHERLNEANRLVRHGDQCPWNLK